MYCVCVCLVLIMYSILKNCGYFYSSCWLCLTGSFHVTPSSYSFICQLFQTVSCSLFLSLLFVNPINFQVFPSYRVLFCFYKSTLRLFFIKIWNHLCYCVHSSPVAQTFYRSTNLHKFQDLNYHLKNMIANLYFMRILIRVQYILLF